CQQHNNYPNSF
nr:immunoglobulin light chain junction region [Macaca mulatta]MOV63523.1 immunoglobulin light chain junction region [Macaca mulatta]